MLKKIALFLSLAMIITAFSTSLALSASVEYDPENPVYSNSRYGFSLRLPPGKYDIFEADNGDGITVTGPKDFMLKAYGEMVMDDPAKSAEELVKYWAEYFGKVQEKDVQKNQLVVQYVKDNILSIMKIYLMDGTRKILLIKFPVDQKEKFEEITDLALKSFN